jgi:hypothetical protein
MADFLDKLSQVLEARRDELQAHLGGAAGPGEAELAELVRDHWQPLPLATATADWPAYAVDGSVRQVSLDNGSYLILVQALALGDGACEMADIDVQVLPATTAPDVVADVKDLCQVHRELFLACEVVRSRAEQGCVLFLDGALYNHLPQLYPRAHPDAERFRLAVLADYLELLAESQRRGVRLVAVSKTSREATHARLWLAARDQDVPAGLDSLSDSELIHRWTDQAAGVSAPVLLGSRGFTGGSRDLLSQPEVAASPAIVSFFIRLADFDDALRVDVPAHQAGHAARLVDLEAGVLPDGPAAVCDTVALLLADYGGLEVYNALLYSVDREVRLRRDRVVEVYLPLIEGMTGVALRRDRSDRRF